MYKADVFNGIHYLIYDDGTSTEYKTIYKYNLMMIDKLHKSKILIYVIICVMTFISCHNKGLRTSDSVAGPVDLYLSWLNAICQKRVVLLSERQVSNVWVYKAKVIKEENAEVVHLQSEIEKMLREDIAEDSIMIISEQRLYLTQTEIVLPIRKRISLSSSGDPYIYITYDGNVLDSCSHGFPSICDHYYYIVE